MEIHPGGGIEEPTLESIKVKNHASKVEFAVGDTFDYTGLTLTAKYSDKTSEEIKEGFTVTLPEANIDSENKVKIAGKGVHNETVKATVTYSEKTTTYDVTIKDNAEVKSIEVSLADSVKKTYAVGDDLDKSGISVHAFYSEEEGAEGEDVTAQATITFTVKGENDADVEFTTEKDGEFDVTITATFDEKTATKTVKITVEAEEDPEETTDYVAPDLSSYYKKYFVTTEAEVEKFGIKADTWGSGSEIKENDDGTLTLTSGKKLWNGTDNGSIAAFTGFTDGLISKYEWIVATLDLSEYTFEGTEVNVKVCHPTDTAIGQLSIVDNWKKNSDGTRTYFAPVSSDTYTNTKALSHEIGLVVYGEGKIVVKEFYIAAKSDPSKEAITGITINPKSETLAQGGTVQFTVKDSSLNDVTSSVEYTLSGDAVSGSEITKTGLLTVGTTAGALTVTATYKVEGVDDPFTAEANVTVMGAMTNLITSEEVSTKFYNPGWSSEGTLSIEEKDGAYTISIPTACTDRWQAQFGVTTDAAISAGDDWYFSFKVKATAATGVSVIKFNNAATVLDKTFSVEAGEEKVVSFSGTAEENFNNIVVFFDFGFSPVNEIEISDLLIAKTN